MTQKHAPLPRLDCVLILALLLAVAVTPLLDFGRQCRQLQTEVFRLHILANSDSPEDQRVKLAVRDAVLAGTADVFAQAQTLAQAEAAARENLDVIQALANAELLRQGYPPTAQAQLTNMYFNTRVYDTATLPAGRYDALRITLGSGSGRNWWCVMFPPLCVEAAAKESSEESQALTEKVEALGQRPNYKLAFASVELVESLREKLRDKNP